MKKHLITLFILVTILFTSSAWAADPNGIWSSSTGSSIKLWGNMQQVYVTVTYNGRSYKYTGWWTRFGEKFAYKTNNGTHYCSFYGSNVINIQNPNKSWTKWTRGARRQTTQRQYNQPTRRSNSTSINGLWASTSGSSVQISTSGQQVYVTLVTTTGKRFQGSGRWLQKGVFDYSIPGFPAVAMATVLSSNKISVSYTGKVTYWHRR